ncbi:MAG: RNA polymerase sigma factor [bacterium]
MKDKLSKYSLEKLAEMIRNESKNSNFAFAEIYSRLSENLYLFICKLTGDSEEASDIFQETFISFHKYLSKNSVNNVSSFIFKIARNLFLNTKRINEKTVPYNEEMKQDEADEIVEQISEYDTELYKKILNEALDTLDFKYKEVFVMRYYLDLDYEKIAMLTDMDVNTLKTRVYRAKNLIREHIEKYYKEIID